MASLIVADASPLIALYDGGCLDVLRLAFDEIVIPDRVLREVFDNPYGRVKPGWIKVRAITKPTSLYRCEILRSTYLLDRGESEAIALAEEMGIEVLLDERNARAICRELSVAHRSAYEVCLVLVQQKRINEKRFAAVARALRLHGGFTPGAEDDIDIA